MIEAGLMTPRGQRMIDMARRTGTWDEHADAQNTVIPSDLARAFAKDPRARENFERFAPSSRRIALEWISKARREETRQKRVVQTVDLAAVNRIAGLPRGMNESRAHGRVRPGPGHDGSVLQE